MVRGVHGEGGYGAWGGVNVRPSPCTLPILRAQVVQLSDTHSIAKAAPPHRSRFASPSPTSSRQIVLGDLPLHFQSISISVNHPPGPVPRVIDITTSRVRSTLVADHFDHNTHYINHNTIGHSIQRPLQQVRYISFVALATLPHPPNCRASTRSLFTATTLEL